MKFVHYVPGGGLGDVARELLWNGALGILKRWKFANQEHHLRVVLMSHNPTSIDLLAGQHWIDEVCAVPFLIAKNPDWVSCYDEYPALFAGRTELRFILRESKSLYRPDLNARRPSLPNVEMISPIGMAADVALTAHEESIARFHERSVVLHPFGGHKAKWFPEETFAQLCEWVPADARVVIAGNYPRPGHDDELAMLPEVRRRVFAPRVVTEIIRRAKAVVGSESVVYYLAAMHGVPTAMLWSEQGEYARHLSGKSDWDFYIGERDSRNLFLPLPPAMTAAQRNQLGEWIGQWGNN